MTDQTPITTADEFVIPPKGTPEYAALLEASLVYLDALILTLASYPEVQDAPQEDAAA